MHGMNWRGFRCSTTVFAVLTCLSLGFWTGQPAWGKSPPVIAVATSPIVHPPSSVPVDLSAYVGAVGAVLRNHGLSMGYTADPSALQVGMSFDPNIFNMTVTVTLTQPGVGEIAKGEAHNNGWGTLSFREAAISRLVSSALNRLDKRLGEIKLTLAQNSNDLQCMAALAQRDDLKPIASKIELTRPITEAAPPFAVAANDTFPADADRPLIAAWATGRDSCLNEVNVHAANPTDGSLAAAVYQQEVAFQRELAGSVSELIVALYQRKLTFGEFATKRYEITRDIAASEHQFRMSVLNADADRQMQARQIAQEALHNRLTAWAAYMQSVQARQPLSVHLEGNVEVGVHARCTSLSSGSLTSTNCY
jgi:hypothetical protein